MPEPEERNSSSPEACGSGEAGAFRIPPDADSPEAGDLALPGRSLILQDLTEKVVSYKSNNPDITGTTPTENDRATVELDIFSPDGALLGHTSGGGRMLFKRQDHFIAYFGERIELLDGNVIRSGGLVDDARLSAGEPATFPAVVISGPLRGAIGFRQFRPLVRETHDTYVSSIVLYRG